MKHHFFFLTGKKNSTHPLRINSNIISQVKHLLIILGKINYSLANSMKKLLLKYLSHWPSCADFTFQIITSQELSSIKMSSTWPGVHSILSLDYTEEGKRKGKGRRGEGHE